MGKNVDLQQTRFFFEEKYVLVQKNIDFFKKKQGPVCTLGCKISLILRTIKT